MFAVFISDCKRLMMSEERLFIEPPRRSCSAAQQASRCREERAQNPRQNRQRLWTGGGAPPFRLIGLMCSVCIDRSRACSPPRLPFPLAPLTLSFFRVNVLRWAYREARRKQPWFERCTPTPTLRQIRDTSRKSCASSFLTSKRLVPAADSVLLTLHTPSWQGFDGGSEASTSDGS